MLKHNLHTAMTEPAPSLDRRLGLLDATTLVAGSMIGSGIFILLLTMAQKVQSPGVLIGVWAVGGLFTVLGAVCYAELAAMFPQAGGQYVFLREAYGPLPAFLFGWTQFTVIQTGFNAAVAIAFAKYLGRLGPFGGLGEANVLAVIHLGRWLPAAVQSRLPASLADIPINSAQVVACVVIALLTVVNVRGVREGARVAEFVHAVEGGGAGGVDRRRPGPLAGRGPLRPPAARQGGAGGGLSGRRGGGLVAGAVRLRRLVHGHVCGRGGPRVAPHASPRLSPGHAAGDAGLRAGERGLPGGPAGRRDPRSTREPGGGAWRRRSLDRWAGPW